MLKYVKINILKFFKNSVCLMQNIDSNNINLNNNGAVEQLKTPPHSIEAEQMLLACILFDESSYIDISGMIYERHFYRKEHQIIFAHIMTLKEQKRNIDAVTIVASLTQSNELDFIGGAEYINSLLEATNNVANIKSYADIIRECFILRELMHAGSEIISLANNTKQRNIDVILDNAEQKIFSIKDLNVVNKQFSNIRDLLNRVIERVTIMAQREDKSLATGIASHYYELDKYTSGLQPGELIIIAGRPGMGKSSFALNIAENIALKNKLPVVVFSLEMTAEQLAQRLLSSKAGVDQNCLKRGDINDEDMDNLFLASNVLKASQIFIAECPGINVIDLRARVRRLKDQTGKLGLIVIDYVQIMSSLRDGYNRGSNRATEIADISRSLKALAIEIDVPIVLLSQLNREVENRVDKRPNIADLRESGALEQDADIVLLLYRDSYYTKDTSDNTAEINIAKNRSGSTGVVKLSFQGKYTRFENLFTE